MKKILLLLLSLLGVLGIQAQVLRGTGASRGSSSEVVSIDTISPEEVERPLIIPIERDSIVTKSSYTILQDFSQPLNLLYGSGYDWSPGRRNETLYNFVWASYSPLFVNSKTAVGFFGSWWSTNSHFVRYLQTNDEWATGVNVKYYTDSLFSGSYNFFWELNTGYKHALDQGQENLYSRIQTDHMFYVSSNFNWFKTRGFFRRLEINASYQKPLYFNKWAYIDEQRIDTEAWNKEYFGSLLKANFLTINLNDYWRFTPRLLASYEHEFHNNNNIVGYGAGLSLYRLYRLDWVHVFYMRRHNLDTGQQFNRVGLEIDLNSTLQVFKSIGSGNSKNK